MEATVAGLLEVITAKVHDRQRFNDVHGDELSVYGNNGNLNGEREESFR